MVIIALLVGLLLPALARTKEEARKVQCRSNMRQIFMAAALYGSDNSGMMPTLYGWGAGNSLSTNDDDEQSSFFHLLTTDVEYGTFDQPAHPTGLGLLFRGGYLTSKGSLVLDCPSRHYGTDVGTKRKSAMEFDADEPFFTSNGRVWLSDADSTGDFHKHATNDSPPPCARPSSGGSKNQYCCLLSSYSLRLGDTGGGFSEIRLEQVPSKGIMSDTLVGFALGSGSGGTDRKRYIQNHEAAWNILFGDGAVKTFSDAPRYVLRKLREGTDMDGGESRTAASRGPSGSYIARHLFEAYFDTAYRQD